MSFRALAAFACALLFVASALTLLFPHLALALPFLASANVARSGRDTTKSRRFGDNSAAIVIDNVLVDTATSQVRTLSSTAQQSAVGSSSSQYGRLVIIPIVLLKVEPSILCPEKEPDAR